MENNNNINNNLGNVIHDQLVNNTISNIKSSGKMKNGIITVKRSDSINHALKLLNENDISSCPVIDSNLGCIGLIDMFDIVEYVHSIFKKRENNVITMIKENNNNSHHSFLYVLTHPFSNHNNNSHDSHMTSTTITMNHQHRNEYGKSINGYQKSSEYLSKVASKNYFNLNIDPVSVIINKTHDVETMLPVIKESNSIQTLISLFEIGCHRVPIYLNNGDVGGVGGGIPKLTRVISQTDVMIWVWENPLIRDKIRNAKSKVYQFYKANPKCVQDDSTTLEVLSILNTSKLSAIAIVNDKGKLKNEMSTDSWKCINEKNMDLLFGDVKSFLKESKKQRKKYLKNSPPLQPVNSIEMSSPPPTPSPPSKLPTCTLDTPMDEIWQLFYKYRFHRVWVIDDKTSKLIGVLSLVDLLKSLKAIL